jgi:Holliday junction resolvase-like predicted endonuclease
MGRRTSTGAVFEKSVAHALEHGGYLVHTQQNMGQRLGGGKHFVDIVAEKGGETILVSLKWQQTSGTAEQKVPYEYICLAHALEEHKTIARAYLVLGGNGWTKREFYVDGLQDWVSSDSEVVVIEGNDFIAIANKGFRG